MNGVKCFREHSGTIPLEAEVYFSARARDFGRGARRATKRDGWGHFFFRIWVQDQCPRSVVKKLGGCGKFFGGHGFDLDPGARFSARGFAPSQGCKRSVPCAGHEAWWMGWSPKQIFPRRCARVQGTAGCKVRGERSDLRAGKETGLRPLTLTPKRDFLRGVATLAGV